MRIWPKLTPVDAAISGDSEMASLFYAFIDCSHHLHHSNNMSKTADDETRRMVGLTEAGKTEILCGCDIIHN